MVALSQTLLLLGRIQRERLGKPCMSFWPDLESSTLRSRCQAIISILEELYTHQA